MHPGNMAVPSQVKGPYFKRCEPLSFLNLLGELAKLFGLPVTCLHLQLQQSPETSHLARPKPEPQTHSPCHARAELPSRTDFHIAVLPHCDPCSLYQEGTSDWHAISEHSCSEAEHRKPLA